jgi:hypothetical protein
MVPSSIFLASGFTGPGRPLADPLNRPASAFPADSGGEIAFARLTDCVPALLRNAAVR